jgi:hypothetical protein
MRWRLSLLSWILGNTCLAPVVMAQLPAFGSSATGPVVVALVNQEPIYLAEVHRYLRRLPTATDENLKEGEPNALEAVIQRQLVLDYLARRDFVSVPTIDAQVERRRSELAKRNERLETICEEQGITESALRRAIAWNIAWPNYLGKTLGYQRLQRYFNDHRAHFDGGNRDVAHILWKVTEPMSEEEQDELWQTATDVRKEIENEEVTFADAARIYSAGPSSATGGELGSIDRNGPMTETFSEVAFNLEPGELSQPVADAFGIHLILCSHAEPGKRKFKQVRSKVEQAARAELFATIADRARRTAKIEYKGIIKKVQLDSKAR